MYPMKRWSCKWCKNLSTAYMKYLCFSVILWGFRDVETFFGLKNIGNPLCFMESGWGCFSSTTTWPKLGCELLEDDLDLRWLEETLCKNGFFWTPRNCYLCFFPTREKKMDIHSFTLKFVLWDFYQKDTVQFETYASLVITYPPQTLTNAPKKDRFKRKGSSSTAIIFLVWTFDIVLGDISLKLIAFSSDKYSVARFSATCFLLENLSLEKTGRIVWPGRGAWVMRWGRPGFRRAPCRGDWLHFGSVKLKPSI